MMEWSSSAASSSSSEEYAFRVGQSTFFARSSGSDKCCACIDFTESTKTHTPYSFVSSVHLIITCRDSEYA